MKYISDYDSYLKLVNNTCVYEHLLRLQNTLNALIDRDKSNITGFLEVMKQLDALSTGSVLQLVGVEFLPDDEQKTVAQVKREQEIQREISEKTEAYQSIVQDWDKIIANARFINQLLALCLQHKDVISHETLKASHRIQQFMTIQDMDEFKDDFLKRLQKDLSHLNIDFSLLSSDNKVKSSSNQIDDTAHTQLQAQLEYEKRKLEDERKKLAEAEKASQEEKARYQAEIERIEREKTEEAKQKEDKKVTKPPRHTRSHVSLKTDQNDIVLKCPKCGKEYQSHHTICLKDGTKLVEIHKNFSV